MTRTTDVAAISAVAQDYLKAIWSATEWGGAAITTTALAARFGTSAANVSETLRRLDAQGLIRHTPYRAPELTDRGHALALAMVRRHRLIETYLAERLGYGWDEVHDEAERLEHAVSDDFVDRIDAALGRPASDPHGDPIPDARGRISIPEAIPLADAPDGRWRVARVSDADPAVLAAAQERGIRPGAEVDVRRDGDGLRVDGSRIDPALAAAVRVTRTEFPDTEFHRHHDGSAPGSDRVRAPDATSITSVEPSGYSGRPG